MLRYMTAGESHGPALVGILDGMPAGLRVDVDSMNRQLTARQGGHGRGGRMKIESDAVEILAGIRGGSTLGSPIAIAIRNRDYENVRALMDPLTGSGPAITKPRPGHADYAGALKYRHRDLRNVLERASARETAMRVALGELSRQYLGVFGVTVVSYVIQIGDVAAGAVRQMPDSTVISRSPVRCLDPDAESEMVRAIDAAKAAGDTLGGVFEILVSGMPVGVGGNRQPYERLDARLAAALMSIQTAKAVEVGEGIASGDYTGSRWHDAFEKRGTHIARTSNRAGGIEGGMSNGEDLLLRARLKPLATLMKPLQSVDLSSGEAAPAAIVRSDVCSVPAAAVIGEAMVCLELAQAFSEKYGGDSVEELLEHFHASQAGAAQVFPAPSNTSPDASPT
ncbi:MAG: chorismate synthase [Candidatus Eremiobacter antarcticus]|nr:chorismate synthase [Candidatus Eremiobacteraeota bacterium]MBC5808889.1 chorismate synthase [Candidatus Eremiobacteraeota bacterium]PZR60426.1 MAG: chorismate synthase [Candidatus Eremiobacter sp. RRmetagenome_bin22]